MGFLDGDLAYVLGAYLGSGVKQRMENKSLKDAIAATMQPQIDQQNLTQQLSDKLGDGLLLGKSSQQPSNLENYLKTQNNINQNNQQINNQGFNIGSLSPDVNQKVQNMALEYAGGINQGTGNNIGPQNNNSLGVNFDWLGNQRSDINGIPNINVTLENDKKKDYLANSNNNSTGKKISSLASMLMQKDSTRDIGIMYDLLDKGFNVDVIGKVLGMDSNRRQREDASMQNELENQRQKTIRNIVDKITMYRASGDVGTANALQMQLYPLLKADADSYTKYMTAAMPNLDMKSTDLGGQTVLTSFDKTGQLGSNNVVMNNSLSPNTAYTGQVSMINNARNNETSRANNINSNNTEIQVANMKKASSKEKDIPKYAVDLDEGFAKALQAINNNDAESGKYVDDFNVTIGKYNSSMDEDDKAHATELMYALNALREFKSGNKDTAIKYASALSPELKNSLGINF